MKKLMSISLAVMLLLSTTLISFGSSVDHTSGTEVTYVGAATEQYTVTVPAELEPGEEGEVVVEGTWASNHTIKVTADDTVTLTNSIDSDTKTLDITFADVEQAGSNTEYITVTKPISVANIEDALFGTWSGEFYYNVSFASDEITESPIYFGEVYGGDTTDGYLLIIFSEDGSNEAFTIENDVLVSAGGAEAGTNSYSGLNIINVESGEIVATVSADGKSIYPVVGDELTLQDGVQYGESYYFFYEDDDDTIYYVYKFYEDGSLEITESDGIESKSVTEPAGSARYDGPLIYNCTSEEELLMGIAFDNGTKILSLIDVDMPLVLVLGEPDIG